MVQQNKIMMKTRETLNYVPLINNSITIGLSFLLLSISAIISSKMIILCFLFGLYLMFLQILFLSFEYSIEALESLKCFVHTSSCFLIIN